MISDKSRTVLITGATGFVGTNLSLYHLSLGDSVIGIDNFCSSPKRNLKTIQNHAKKDKFRFIEADINTFDFPKVRQKIDRIYNLACPASPPKYQKDPLFTIRTCTNGVTNVLELAKRKGATVLQASTSEIYGDPEVHPQTEEYRGNVNTIGPRACYDEGKRLAETLCYEYKQQGVDVRIARIFNTYGPHMSPTDGRVITNFIDQALSAKPITIYGHGKQTRSFQYVDDLIAGFIALTSSRKKLFGPYNLGNPTEFTINELAKTVLKITKSKSEIKHLPLPKDDPTRRKPDISKAKKELKWRPTVSLETGLKNYIDWYSTIRKQ